MRPQPIVAIRRFAGLVIGATALLASACIVDKSSDSGKKGAGDSAATTSGQMTPAPSTTPADSTIAAESDVSVPAYDSASLDTAGLGRQIGNLPALSGDTLFKHMSSSGTPTGLASFPARIPARGPMVLQLEILLDRANFSPGIIDGTWGANAAKALAAFKMADTASKSVGPSASRPSIDKATYDKLVAAANTPDLVTSYQVTANDVKGPFVQIPNLVYDQAKLQCLCYTSAAEELAEKFHTSQQLLQRLNPGVNFKSLTAGKSIQVPNVETTPTGSTASVAKIVISRRDYWTNALDVSGKIVAHFPSTLGAGYDPSPTGDFHITNVAHNPSFKYQPALMAEVPDSRPTAKLPPGPNSPVGVVWMALSKPHYGIHGTSSPETIGYANSHGCVRLTNWDAQRLAHMVKPGTPVVFQ